MPNINQSIDFNSNIPYYIQLIDVIKLPAANGNPGSKSSANPSYAKRSRSAAPWCARHCVRSSWKGW